MDKIEERKQELIKTVKRELPDFAHAVNNETNDTVVLHQDSFGADYTEEEYGLLGKAIKFAGIYGKTVQIHGTNGETLKG